MNDLFAVDDAPAAVEQRTMHGKLYTLRTAKVGGVDKWAIKWITLDGTRHGGVGGYYATPEMAWAELERHPEALASLQGLLAR